MTHLETLIAEYLEWQGYLIKKNIKVGKRVNGGWEMEFDVVGYNPETKSLVHYEPSLDSKSWKIREKRYNKKFKAGRKYILKKLFNWLPPDTKLEQIAIFSTHPPDRDSIAGGRIMAIDELVVEINKKVLKCGKLRKNAIPEQFPLLRTIQLSYVGYNRLINKPPKDK